MNWIVDQEHKRMYNIDRLVNIECEGCYITADAEHSVITLGEYATEKRAKEVFKWIMKEIDMCRTNGRIVGCAIMPWE